MIWGLLGAIEEGRRQGRLARMEPYRVGSDRLERIVSGQQGDGNADAVTMAQEILNLRAALEPFAALARGRYPDEGGAPSFIDIMTNDGEFNELELRSHVAVSDHIEILDAEDFRRAERLLREFGL